MTAEGTQSKPGFLVRKITALCQLQDFGRHGYQSFGVSRSGAADLRSLRIANALVGNPQTTACLELAMLGAVFELTAATAHCAFAGDFPLSVNDKPVDTYRSFRMFRGDVLTIGSAVAGKGIRGYLSIEGGFDCPPQLGSCSTHLRSGFCSLSSAGTSDDESGLIANDQLLPITSDNRRESRAQKNAPCFSLPEEHYQLNNQRIRVVPGPQSNHFTEQGIHDFYRQSFTVGRESDRMGLRLKPELQGSPIAHKGDGNIISDPVMAGSIQVPPSGLPIVLMPDGPTTGGYPKIATVASVDLSCLGQLAAGNKIAFKAISIDEAQELLKAEHRFFDTLPALLVPCENQALY